VELPSIPFLTQALLATRPPLQSRFISWPFRGNIERSEITKSKARKLSSCKRFLGAITRLDVTKDTQGKRPKPAALMKQIVTEIFLPIADAGEPNFTDYQDVDIDRVWDYGPIGYTGRCLQHKSLEFYVAKLELQEPLYMIIPGFGVDQLNRMLKATHEIEGLRWRSTKGRKRTGYAESKFEFRTTELCFPLVIEENYGRTGLICRTLALRLKPDEICTPEMFDELYPEK